MDSRKQLKLSYLSFIEHIANGKNNLLHFDKDMQFYRGEIHLIKLIGDKPGLHGAQLAAQMNVTRAVVHKTLKKLEARDLICKEEDLADRKCLRIFLTEKGKRAYDLHENYHCQMDADFFSFLQSLNEEEIQLLQKFLDLANQMNRRHF